MQHYPEASPHELFPVFASAFYGSTTGLSGRITAPLSNVMLLLVVTGRGDKIRPKCTRFGPSHAKVGGGEQQQPGSGAKLGH